MQTRLDPRSLSLGQLGMGRLASLAEGVGFLPAQISAMQELFGELLHPWAGDSSSQPPAWLSDVSDDHSPYEFSIAVGGAQPELRVLVESRGDPPTLESNQVWGTSINAMLRRRYGA